MTGAKGAAGPSALVVGLVCGVLAWSLVWAPVVVGELVVPPVVLTAVVALVLLTLVWRRGRSRLATGGWTAWLGPGLLTPAVVVLVLARLAWSLGTTYTLLEPAGPSGCRVLATESSFMFSGQGSAAAVGRWGGLALEQSSWTADDGARPIDSGSYRLTWEGDAGALALSGDAGDPVWPGLHEVGCG